MEFINDNLKINYQKYGQGEEIIIIHGWGRSIKDFNSIAKVLSKKYKVYLIDLPGFGNSDEPEKPYELDDYINLIENFVQYQKITNPIIIGHSFGGRIGIRYAIKNKVQKMILISSAGIKRFSLKVKIKIIRYKIKKWFYRKFNKVSAYEKLVTTSGSADYIASSDIMKKTLSNVISINQTKELNKITCEVLLIWGKDDQATPYKDALLMQRKIKNVGLVTLNTGHFCFLEDSYTFNKVIMSYLGIEEK